MPHALTSDAASGLRIGSNKVAGCRWEEARHQCLVEEEDNPASPYE